MSSKRTMTASEFRRWVEDITPTLKPIEEAKLFNNILGWLRVEGVSLDDPEGSLRKMIVQTLKEERGEQ